MKLDQTSNGVPFRSHVVNQWGDEFILFPNAEHSPSDIKNAIAELRDNRDAVSIRVARDEDLDNLFVDQVFRHPEVKPLKWFEVYQDYQVIRTQRQKGMTAEEFVNVYVLPNVEQTREANLKKWPWLSKD